VAGGGGASRRRRERAEAGRRRDGSGIARSLGGGVTRDKHHRNLIWSGKRSIQVTMLLIWSGGARSGRREVTAALGRREAPPLCRGAERDGVWIGDR